MKWLHISFKWFFYMHSSVKISFSKFLRNYVWATETQSWTKCWVVVDSVEAYFGKILQCSEFATLVPLVFSLTSLRVVKITWIDDNLTRVSDWIWFFYMVVYSVLWPEWCTTISKIWKYSLFEVELKKYKIYTVTDLLALRMSQHVLLSLTSSGLKWYWLYVSWVTLKDANRHICKLFDWLDTYIMWSGSK